MWASEDRDGGILTTGDLRTPEQKLKDKRNAETTHQAVQEYCKSIGVELDCHGKYTCYGVDIYPYEYVGYEYYTLEEKQKILPIAIKKLMAYKMAKIRLDSLKSAKLKTNKIKQEIKYLETLISKGYEINYKEVLGYEP
jgi:hypothetical protein